jgi:hypothetical protein
MDFGSMLDDSFAYAKDAVWERRTRWLLLMVSLLIFPLILGYMVRIYRGEKPAPEPGEWLELFIDGLKLLVVEIVYMAPVILLIVLAFIPLIATLVSSGMFSPGSGPMSDTQFERWMDSHPEVLSQVLISLGFMILLLLIAVGLAIIITFFSFLGVVRFARKRSISEAFNFSEILAHIRRIGWINYIIALIAITIIGYIFSMILNFFSFIPIIGIFIELLLMVVLYVPFLVFSARYSVLVYDAGEPSVPISDDEPIVPANQ